MNQKSFNNFSDRKLFYLKTLDEILARNSREFQSQFHVPQGKGLHQRIPHYFFHYTPELFFQIQGTTIFTFPQEKLSLRGSHLALIQTGLPHHERAIDFPDRFFNFVMMILPKGFSFHGIVASSTKRPQCLNAPDLFFTEDRNRIVSYLEDIAQAEVLPKREIATFRENLLRAVFILLRKGVQSGSAPDRENLHPKILLCNGYIEIHLQNPELGVHEIASHLGYSSDYLTHLYRKETGVNLFDFITKKRIDRAKGLLGQPHLNVAEIAWNCGYSDPSYFSRIFKKLTRLTPLEFRKK